MVFWRLARIFLDDERHEKRLDHIVIPYWEMGQGDLQVDQDRVVLVAGSPDHPMSLLEVTLEDSQLRVLRVESEDELPSGYLSVPESIEFPTTNEQTSHAFFTRPPTRTTSLPKAKNRRCSSPATAAPTARLPRN